MLSFALVNVSLKVSFDISNLEEAEFELVHRTSYAAGVTHVYITGIWSFKRKVGIKIAVR